MTEQDKQQEIEQLAKKIEEADTAYYDAANPVKMSDDEYDLLKDRLEQLDPKHPLLKKVGAAPVTGNWPKRQHAAPMGSLTKVKGLEGLKDWWAKMEAS